MTHSTALALIRRADINAELCAAGRRPTRVDQQQARELLDAADVEDALGLHEAIQWCYSSRFGRTS